MQNPSGGMHCVTTPPCPRHRNARCSGVLDDSCTFADYGTLFKADGVTREGFIAHEVAEVIPSGCEGEKDKEDSLQSLRIDAIVSVLTKAVQELAVKVEALEAK